MEKASLFFVGILPDERIQKEVTTFKQECARHFKASHALKSPPHITLIPPFPWQLQHLGTLIQSLKQFAKGREAFELQLQGFNCFKPRVIFVEVVENGQLKSLQQELSAFLEKDLGMKDERAKRFHPHMTIAHRDLKQWVFPQAWEHFSQITYQRTFPVDHIALLEHLNHKWLVRETFGFA